MFTLLGSAQSLEGSISRSTYIQSQIYTTIKARLSLTPFYVSPQLPQATRDTVPFLSSSHRSFHSITPFGSYLPDFKPGAQNIVGVSSCSRFQREREGDPGCDQALSFQMLINSALNFITKRDWKCSFRSPLWNAFLGIHPRATRSTLAAVGFVEGRGRIVCIQELRVNWNWYKSMERFVKTKKALFWCYGIWTALIIRENVSKTVSETIQAEVGQRYVKDY